MLLTGFGGVAALLSRLGCNEFRQRALAGRAGEAMAIGAGRAMEGWEGVSEGEGG